MIFLSPILLFIILKSIYFYNFTIEGKDDYTRLKEEIKCFIYYIKNFKDLN